MASGQAVSGIDVTLAKGGSISGRLTLPPGFGSGFSNLSTSVVTADSDTPVSHGDVTFGGNGTGVFEYWISGIPAGSYKLLFSGESKGAADQWYGGANSFEAAKTITVAAGQDATGIDVVLPLGGTIRGTVTLPPRADLPGTNVSQVSVVAFPAGSTPGIYDYRYRKADVSADGSYEIKGLGTGTYKLQFGSSFWEATLIQKWSGGANSFETASPINVVLGQDTAGVNITLGQLATVSGKAAIPAGADASKISVWLSSADQAKSSHSAQIQLGPDGSYKFTGVPAGDYKVHFYDHSNYTLAHWYGGTEDEATARIVKVPTSQTVSGIDTTMVKAGSNVDVPAAPSFTDVAAGTQFGTEIMWMANVGISTGWTEPGGVKSFRPLTAVNRDAMAAFMYRLAGKPDFTPPAVSPFADVATDNQFYKEITWLASKGISTGWPEDRTFRPLQPVNRDAMAAFLYRLAGKPEFQAAPAFQDVAGGSRFFKEIGWLAAEKISTGWDEGNNAKSFRPLQAVNRNAMAAFMYRFNAKHSAIR